MFDYSLDTGANIEVYFTDRISDELENQGLEMKNVVQNNDRQVDDLKESSIEGMIEDVNNIVIKKEEILSLNNIYDLEKQNFIMCQYDAIQALSQCRCKPLICLFEESNMYRESIFFLDLYNIIKQRDFGVFIENIEKIEWLTKMLTHVYPVYEQL